MSAQPRAEVAEQSAASPCPYCAQRPVGRNFRTGQWICCNCGEYGPMAWEPGTPPRETATPLAPEFDHA